jgi:pimeloyl-ACP methyl ester carboxylesterase
MFAVSTLAYLRVMPRSGGVCREVTTMATTTATAIDLYHEIRGNGPAVLLIPGATGDAGHFTRTAERLADEFTMITYDRRGNSRSAVKGDPVAAAAMAAQADDASALILACGFSQAVVFGTSGGAEVALELLVRQPQTVRGAIIHEPPLISLLPQDGPSPLEPIFELARSDPRAALEAFVRVNSSDAAWEGLEASTRERMLGNAVTLFQHEIGEFVSYVPDQAALRETKVPVVPLVSRHGLPFAPAVQSWLEVQIGVPGGTLSGHHAPYFDMPEVFAEELRPVLKQLWN